MSRFADDATLPVQQQTWLVKVAEQWGATLNLLLMHRHNGLVIPSAPLPP